MNAFVSRKRRRAEGSQRAPAPPVSPGGEDESTAFTLALLASLHPTIDETTLLEALLASDRIVEQASEALAHSLNPSPRKRAAISGTRYQSSLSSYRSIPAQTGPAKKSLVKKGKTLSLYTPE